MKKIDFAARLSKVRTALSTDNVDAIFVTPGSDLRYLTGYDALPLERLTCLAITSDATARMVVPRLELPAAQHHELDRFGIEIIAWDETDDPIALLNKVTGPIKSAAVNDTMWAQKALGIQDSFGAKLKPAGRLLSDIRAVKDEAEISAVAAAGAAIDEVHQNMSLWLKSGRTEREVARDIAEAILASGHQRVDFVIVASGPNGASPHHESSDRVIGVGEPVVVDIGGTMPSGYCSDCTRMYVYGEPPAEFVKHFDTLKLAQEHAVAAVAVGMSGAEADSLARDILAANGLGEYFVHRTGHGLGLDTHEEPYIVASNHEPLVTGNVFSIEPGFYIPGKFGARIEDIVALTADGLVNFNNTSHELTILNS
jgi:Xaa-Pro aminopeptidase